MQFKSVFQTVIGALLILVLALGGVAFAQDDDAARPWLGISIDANPQGGALVNEVVADSPAEAAGILANDVILSAGDSIISKPQDLIRKVRAMQPGDSLTLTIFRDGAPQIIDVTLAEAPADMVFEEMPEPGQPGSMPGFPGFEGREGSFMVVPGAMVMETDEGWLVEQTMPNSDLQQGDVITAINGTPVAELEMNTLGEIFGDMMNDGVEYTVQRGGETLTITIEAGSDMMFFPGGMGMSDRVLLGVQFDSVENGAQVIGVLPNSPAANAGIQADDIITAVNETSLNDETNLIDALADFEAGDTVTLSILRGEETLTLDVTLEAVDPGAIGMGVPMLPGIPFTLPEGFDPDDLENLDLDNLNLEGFENLTADLMPNLNLQALDDLIGQLDLPDLQPGESASFTCQDTEGNAILSVEISRGENGETDTNLSLENLSADDLANLNLETLTCDIQPTNSTNG